MASVYSSHERAVLAEFARTAIPAGKVLPGAGEETVARLEEFLVDAPPLAIPLARAVPWAIEAASTALCGRPFSRLEPERRARFIELWYQAPVPALRHALRGVLSALRVAHFERDSVHASRGCTYGRVTAHPENARWLSRVTDGREVTSGMELEADVVIVGSGAGGGALAYELASRGHAVLVIEEGKYFRRHDFNGRTGEMTRAMYRNGGLTIALGNVSAPVWAGCTVGGTTTINSGTCYRTPERTFKVWREWFGLDMFSSESMDRYYERVEGILGVQEARTEHLGTIARVIARGADRLGYTHGPLRRNAPDCDGQGLCCFGCPTGAKRSADVSYVPMALERGAELVSSARVDRIVHERGRARGIIAQCAGGGTLSVRARMTVIAGGALMTPGILLRNGLANRSGMVGKNLSVHPAQKVMALFREPIAMDRGIPQGYGIEHFADEGLMFEGCSTPFEVTALGIPFPGTRFTEVLERYEHLASFGFMLQDTSRGRVLPGPHGSPRIAYSLNDQDTARIQRGVEILCRVFLEAGAESVFPSVHGFDELRSHDDFARLQKHKLRAGDLEITAHHPLGTARMGRDPQSSVVGPDHQAHDVGDLYVVDGSAIPGPLGVNPQLTIMAMATRAAEIMDERLSRGDVRSEPRETDVQATEAIA
jgi:choline dehydrogenase-like flavoprotein